MGYEFFHDLRDKHETAKVPEFNANPRAEGDSRKRHIRGGQRLSGRDFWAQPVWYDMVRGETHEQGFERVPRGGITKI